jgi:dephospho-CoA kinase
MAWIGITGAVGSGKSSVLRCLAAFGAATWDADAAVHSLYEPGAAGYRLLLERYGRNVVDEQGTLDRAFVARRVFADATERRWLEAQIHPLVKEQLAASGAAAAPATLWCAVPLLYETGWAGEFTVTVAVWCDPATRRQRLRARGWSDAEIAARDAAQLSEDEKLVRADHAIINTGSLAALAAQCRRLHDRLVTPEERRRNASHG